MVTKINIISNFLKAISDENRLKIIIFLRSAPRCVCEIYPMLNVSQKLASHHLSQLKKADLVQTKRKGNFIYYSINDKVLERNLTIINSTLKYEKTRRDKENCPKQIRKNSQRKK